MKRKFVVLGSGTAAACLLLAGIAISHADEKEKKSVADQATVSIQEAIDVATAAFPGKVVEAELEEEDGRPIYTIEIVGENGKTMEVEIDAKTAKVLGKEQEDGDEHEEDKEDD